jgi:hypothetical protein
MVFDLLLAYVQEAHQAEQAPSSPAHQATSSDPESEQDEQEDDDDKDSKPRTKYDRAAEKNVKVRGRSLSLSLCVLEQDKPNILAYTGLARSFR